MEPSSPPSPKETPGEAAPARSETCPIVGIGASAGGLEATRALFDALPDEPGFAVVVIQHLDPTKKSYTPELLEKCTKMQIGQVEDDPVVKPNRFYIIPPGKYLHISQGRLHLSEPAEPRGRRRAIDFFLRSLAEDQKQRAVGVILSGTGTDGTLGIKAIKQHGGMVIAQEPHTAGHEGMPRSAINTGVVDYVLPPDKIPEMLVRYARHPYVCSNEPDETTEEEAPREAPTEAPPDEQDAAGLNSILGLLQAHTQHDFQNYKDKTLRRRTLRRMCLLHLQDYEDYLEYLREHPAEVEALVKDLLISVTDFFRDAEAWQELQPLIHDLVRRKEPGDPIRVWVPGCATGEEPYSAAMLLMEELQQIKKPCPVQVFASDIDKDALDYARQGRYPSSIEADVSQERLERFFIRDDGDEFYRVSKPLREAVVFAEQNLISDPPFSKLDLICCRNLLIYLKPDVQEKIVSMFHFALVDGGYLFLGSSETIGRHTELFEIINKRWRLYRRIGPTRHNQVQIPISAAAGTRRRGGEPAAVGSRQQAHWAHLAQQHLLNWLAPQAVLVDQDWRMLYLSGGMDDYLRRGAGIPSDHLLENCRPGLRTRVRGAVHEALKEKHTVSVVATVQQNKSSTKVRITVRPLPKSGNLPELALVTFEPESAKDSLKEVPKTNQPPDRPYQPLASDQKSAQASGTPPMEFDDHAVIRQLEEELAGVRWELQATMEQLEMSSEEYKASNEEVMSINEELQSTNEELETSTEELQTLNEELTTVNNQLASKVDELETQHADLENLIAATDVATVCLDMDLCIRWFTPAAKSVVRVTDADQGRSISDFAHDFVDGDLVETALQVLKNLVPAEHEVRCQDDRYFVRRIIPYRTDDHRIGGVVITFVDITSRKRSEKELRESELRLRLAAESARFGTYDIDFQTGKVHWSKEMKELFGLSPDEEVPGGPGEISQHVHPADRKEVQRAWQAALDPQGDGLWDAEYRIVLPSGETRWVMSRGLTHFEGEGKHRQARRSIGTALDVTRRKQAEIQLQELNTSLEVQVARRIAALAVLQDITVAANEARTVRQAAGTALARICTYNGWTVGHLWQISDENPQELISLREWYLSQEPLPDAEVPLEEFQRRTEETPIPVGENFVGQVAQSGQPAWLDDVNEYPHWHRGNPHRFGMVSAVAFPIYLHDEVVAVLEFYADRPIQRDERFIEVMSAIGIQLGHVFQRQRLERAIDTATSQYQRYIAQELHDSVAQELTGTGLMAEVLKETIAQGHPDLQLAVKLQAHLREAGDQVRRLSHGLMPVMVDAEGLMHALKRLVEQACELYSLDCQFHCEVPVSVENADVATHLYRIAQEAMQNSAKHAHARHCDLTLRREGEEVVLIIQDDGSGISETDRHDGQGWQIMRHRANIIGGVLDIQSGNGHGVTITCRVRQPDRDASSQLRE